MVYVVINDALKFCNYLLWFRIEIVVLLSALIWKKIYTVSFSSFLSVTKCRGGDAVLSLNMTGLVAELDRSQDEGGKKRRHFIIIFVKQSDKLYSRKSFRSTWSQILDLARIFISVSILSDEFQLTISFSINRTSDGCKN